MKAIVVGICAWLGCWSLPAASPANSFDLPAWAFVRGNAQVFTNQWADAQPMAAFGGESPVVMEYEFDAPVAADYTISFEYAAQQSRPVNLTLDGQELGQACRAVTGSWNTSRAQWERALVVPLTTGKHTLRLERDTDFPHLVAIRFESAASFPPDWKAPVLPRQPKVAAHPPAAFKPYTPPVDFAALRRAITDLTVQFDRQYPRGAEYLQRLDRLEVELKRLEGAPGGLAAAKARRALEEQAGQLRREALLANPLLNFEQILCVRRPGNAPRLGLPANWESNSSLPMSGYNDALCLASLKPAETNLAVLYKPATPSFVGDVDLHFDARRLLFSMPGTNGHWQVFELALNQAGAGAARQLTGDQQDVHSYDACYLPDGRIVFTSTACFIGVPCVYGSSHVANLYLMDHAGRNIRQLTFDQEHDWCPTLLNNGRVLYTRWEYTDTPHSNTRLLFHMNPDGTEQMEFLGSNSYWPNSFFYARPIPGHATKVVSIISGHHGDTRMGELVVFDPAKGRFEAEGAVQKIPGHGKPVDMVFRDQLTTGIFPKFLHPYPLSDKYFLVSCKPTPQAPWGIYLVDVFDNMLPLFQEPGQALLEPLPLRATTPPPALPDKVNASRKDAIVYIQDIYAGDGLKGLPRGSVKSLRVFTYHFAYQEMGGLLGVIGLEGPWDIKRVLGTVPVNEDGSVQFRAPANLPISVQPLDAEGKAMQLMRSWMTGMPGEVVQCAGCHEKQNHAPLMKATAALKQPPAEIKPWHGPLRGFNFAREVQPVLDKYCVDCHHGEPRADGSLLVNLRGDVRLTNWSSITPGNGGEHAGKFSIGYAELCRFVRRPGIESDYHMLEPMEFHADTTELVQLLKRGHHGVQLDAEAWDRLVTWIDLNCPFHGTWGEELAKPGRQVQRRRELLKLYAGLDDDPEQVPALKPYYQKGEPKPVVASREAAEKPNPAARVEGWPFDAAEAARRQAAAAKGSAPRKTVDLGNGVSLELALIPAGEYLMGSLTGAVDEQPQARVRIDRPFWMAVREVDNRTFQQFNPAHDSRIEDKNAYQFGVHGYPANRPEQPVVRVSWQEAMAFCRWLSARTGQRFTLPTEAQWEYACRAGAATPFYFGDFNADFSPFANFADAKLSEFASDPYTVDVPLKEPTPFDDWLPKDARFNDGALLTVAPGRYRANVWGLCDLHGNAAEWTRTTYHLQPGAGADDLAEDRKVVRGGSWHDVPKRGTASFRLSYQPWQKVYNVGFRVICEVGDDGLVLKR